MPAKVTIGGKEHEMVFQLGPGQSLHSVEATGQLSPGTRKTLFTNRVIVGADDGFDVLRPGAKFAKVIHYRTDGVFLGKLRIPFLRSGIRIKGEINIDPVKDNL